jgi:hypothetical protein
MYLIYIVYLRFITGFQYYVFHVRMCSILSLARAKHGTLKTRVSVPPPNIDQYGGFHPQYLAYCPPHSLPAV